METACTVVIIISSVNKKNININNQKHKYHTISQEETNWALIT